MSFMVNNGLKEAMEFGPGQVLTNLLKRSYPDIITYNMRKIEDIYC
jgi:hypothetical protein